MHLQCISLKLVLCSFPPYFFLSFSFLVMLRFVFCLMERKDWRTACFSFGLASLGDLFAAAM